MKEIRVFKKEINGFVIPNTMPKLERSPYRYEKNREIKNKRLSDIQIGSALFEVIVP